MHEVKIYGYISNVAEKTRKDVSLLDVQNQLKSANGEAVKVRINSHGGDAEEGFAIYNELRRYAKDNNVEVHTFAESRLGSIATIIFLAGDKRELSKDLQPFVHKAFFDTDEEISESQKAELEILNKRLARHYADHTELTVKEALQLMENDTWIDPKEALAMRFCTSIEEVLRPVAIRRIINKNQNEMSNKNNPLIAFANAIAKAFKDGVAVNKIVYTADNKEVDFYELEEDENVETGANALIDGEPAEGEVTMQDGKKYIFENGVLIDIRDEETADEDSEEVVALKAENEELKKALEDVTAVAKKQQAIIENAKRQTSKAVANPDKTKQTAPAKEVSRASKVSENFKKTFNKK